MAVASLIVAITAVLIAIASAAYTRSQARSAAGTLAIESSRRLEERRPRLSGKVEMIGGGAHRLAVTLDSDEPIGGLEVSLRYGQGAEFDRNVYGVWPLPRPGEQALTAFAYDPMSNEPAGLAPRESAIWKLDLTDNHANPILLEGNARGTAGEQWNAIHIAAEVETEPIVGVI